MAELNRYWNLAFFTAGQKEYAKGMRKLLDPKDKLITNVLHREHCTEILIINNGKQIKEHIKDLEIIQNYPLKKIVLLDNKIISFALQEKNGVPILPFYGDKRDSELLSAIPYLKQLSSSRSFQEDISKRYVVGQLLVKKY